MHDAGDGLGVRARRDAVTLSQLAARGITTSGLHRRCHGCGSADHGAIRSRNGAAVGISHSRSRDWYAFAVSASDSALGVDIEHAERSHQALRAASMVQGADDPPVGGDATVALRTFVRKEAILKACGTGFHRDPRDQPTAAHSRRRDWLRTNDGWWLYERRTDDLLLCLAAMTPQSVNMTLNVRDVPAGTL